ncbi:MAG TPA: family 16 glycosylhydrolase [Polyangiaceae bacterium]|nr:family 16 glycosylhydrolase [Polyangiaceae bacterium]
MRRALTRVCWAALPLVGCGFDTVTPAPSTGGAGNTGNAGSSSMLVGGMPGVAGTSSAGQPGSAGTGITPMGGNAGSDASGGTSPGGSSNGGAAGTSNQGGTSGSGGAAGSGGSGGNGGAAEDPHYKLLWRDDFDSFNAARWTKQTHTFAENAAKFSADNVVVEGGLLKLKVTNVPNGGKPYSAAEVATIDQFTFGRFVGRIKFCAGSGMVSSLFTYKDNVNQSWQEIDIEHLGNLPKSVQYNLISGNLDNRVYQPKVVTFAWSPPTEFHDYSIEWQPDGITFYVDGAQTHHDVQASIKDAAKLHMNAWPTDNAVTQFAGPFNPAAVPCEAQYDWIEAYSYTP